MQKFLIIGLGNFGLHIAKSLKEFGSDVTGIDISNERLLKAKDFLSHSLAGDAAEAIDHDIHTI